MFQSAHAPSTPRPRPPSRTVPTPLRKSSTMNLSPSTNGDVRGNDDGDGGDDENGDREDGGGSSSDFLRPPGMFPFPSSAGDDVVNDEGGGGGWKDEPDPARSNAKDTTTGSGSKPRARGNLRSISINMARGVSNSSNLSTSSSTTSISEHSQSGTKPTIQQKRSINSLRRLNQPTPSPTPSSTPSSVNVPPHNPLRINPPSATATSGAGSGSGVGGYGGLGNLPSSASLRLSASVVAGMGLGGVGGIGGDEEVGAGMGWEDEEGEGEGELGLGLGDGLPRSPSEGRGKNGFAIGLDGQLIGGDGQGSRVGSGGGSGGRGLGSERMGGHSRSNSNISNVSGGTGTGSKADGSPWDWIGLKSREELERLLVEADRVIRERERDLGMAASIGKSLLENNMALRAKQEALVAKLNDLNRPSPSPARPESPPRTAGIRPMDSPYGRTPIRNGGKGVYVEGLPPPSPSRGEKGLSADLGYGFPSSSPYSHVSDAVSDRNEDERSKLDWETESENDHDHDQDAFSATSGSQFHTPHASRSGRPRPSLTPSLNKASPTTLAQLNVQNSELATQLQELEQETARNDAVGRKKLRRLDKELAGLRRELEMALVRNEELEDELRKSVGVAAVAAVLGSSSSGSGGVGGDGDEEDEEEDDSEGDRTMKKGGGVGPPSYAASMSQSDIRPTDNSESPLPNGEHYQHQSHSRSISETPSLTPSSSGGLGGGGGTSFKMNEGERAVISQLLGKIAELQDTNEAIAIQRNEMDERLERAHKEMENLRMSYEELEEEFRLGGGPGGIEDGGRMRIGWREDEDDGDSMTGFTSSSRKFKGNRKMIEKRRREVRRRSVRAGHGFGGGGDLDSSFDTSSVGSVSTSSPSGHLAPPRPVMKRTPSAGSWFDGEEWERNGNGPSEDVMDAIKRSDSDRPVTGTRFPSSSVTTLARRSRDPSPFTRTLRSELGGGDGGDDEREDGGGDLLLRPEYRLAAVMRTDDGRQWLDSDADLIARGCLRDDVAPNAEAYEVLEQTLSELPVSWADDDDFGRAGARGKRRGNGMIEWGFVDHEDETEVDPWEETKYPELESAEAIEERDSYEEKFQKRMRKQQRLLRRSRSEGVLAGRAVSSGLAAVGLGSSDDGTGESSGTVTGVTSVSGHGGGRQLARRSRALRKYGEDGEDGSGSEFDDEPFQYVDSLDTDNKKPGSRGADYYPVSLRARYHPSMVGKRVQDATMVYMVWIMTWIRFVVVLSLAIGVAVYNGPEKALGIRRTARRRLGRD